MLTLAALVLAAGSLSDIYGRRRVFILGVVVFVAASALCAAAPTIELLVAARFAQGIGGALLTPGSLAIIDAVFHPDDRTRAIGIWAGLGAARIHPGDSYLAAVLPSLVVFGIGLAALITPITATVLASVDARHSGIASAVNNAVSRLGQMIAVAVLPLAAGLSGANFADPAKMAAGFPVAMTIAAGTSFAAALLAWTTISADVLSRPRADTEPVAMKLPPTVQRHCAVAGTPLAMSPNPRPSAHPPTVKES